MAYVMPYTSYEVSGYHRCQAPHATPMSFKPDGEPYHLQSRFVLGLVVNNKYDKRVLILIILHTSEYDVVM